MPAPINSLKQRLAAKDTLHGIWLGLADSYSAEIADTAGFDWLLIDGEHAPNDIRSLSAQLAVIRRSSAVLRLPDDDPTKIKQVLDIGAQTILVPMVESAAQAEAIWRATRYPPNGCRGVGSALARASQFAGIADYLHTADAQICLILQIESVKGIAALDEILAVPDIDGIFIGPSDLAADMGHIGNPTHPEVKATLLEAITRIRQAGRSAGVLSTDPELIAACKDRGANFIGLGIDVTLFASALRGLAKRYCAG